MNVFNHVLEHATTPKNPETQNPNPEYVNKYDLVSR